MKKEIKIELNEKELSVILAEHFKVSKESASVNVYKSTGGNQREPDYTRITFTAPFKTDH